MRSQAQQQSNNTVPMSYFRKYILLLIYTFIHKINNHKKIIRLNKILRKKGDNPTLYNSFGISGCIIHAICTKGCSGGVRAGAGWGRVTDSDVALKKAM